MKRSISLLLFALATGCTDQPTLSPSTGLSTPVNSATSSRPPGVDTRHLKGALGKGFATSGSQIRRVEKGGAEVIVAVTRVFDAEVVEKSETHFVVKGDEGQKCVLIPTHSFASKPAAKSRWVNYGQFKVRDRLRVHLSLQLPFPATYVCELVELHGVTPDGLDLRPFGAQRDNKPSN